MEIKRILFVVLLFSGILWRGFAVGDDKNTGDKNNKDFLELSAMPAPLAISLRGSSNIEKYLSEGMAPLGSAAITESGKLASGGIKHIIHAASGSMARSDGIFSPSLEGVELSVKNAVLLADHYKLDSLAFPFIGSGIFLSRMGASKEKLALSILQASTSGKARAVAVAYSQEDFDLFTKTRELLEKAKREKLRVLKGSITDFSLHKSPAIVNAANTELVFGGGVSGVIARASGEPEKINSDCRKLIQALRGK